MRTVFWLTSVTLVAGAVTTIAVADYVYRHPTSILGRWMARLVDGKSEVDPQPDRPRYSAHVPVTPTPAELAEMAQLAQLEEPEAPHFPTPDAVALASYEAKEDEPAPLASGKLGSVTSDLDIPIRNSSFGAPKEDTATAPRVAVGGLGSVRTFTNAPKEDLDAVPPVSFPLPTVTPVVKGAPPVSTEAADPDAVPPPPSPKVVSPSVTKPQQLLVRSENYRMIQGEWVRIWGPRTNPDEKVEVLTVMPRRVVHAVRWVDENGVEHIGIDFEGDNLPRPVKDLFEEKACPQAKVCEDWATDCAAECPCASLCKALGHCLFGWMVGLDCLEDCRHAGVECPVPYPPDWRRPRMAVNAVDCCPKKSREVDERFDRLVSVDYKNKPLHEVLDEIRDLTGLNVVADRPSLEQEGVSLDRGVHIQLKHVKLGKALQLILRDAHCCYTMEDGILIVTTPRAAKGKLVQCVHPVGDLVCVFDGKHRIDALRKLITHTVEPASWDEMGGEGHLEYFPLGMSLVVRQTPGVQEQVQLMLDRLRELTMPQGTPAAQSAVRVMQQTYAVPVLQRGTSAVVLPQPTGLVTPAGWKLGREELQQAVVLPRPVPCHQPMSGVRSEMPCPMPCIEPCVDDDYIEMEAEEIELDFGKVKLRCKGFRMSAPTKAIGMLKGCDLDVAATGSCCKQGCCEEEKDLVAEFMKYEPTDVSEEGPCDGTWPEINEAALEASLRKFDELWSTQPETPEKLPVCDHPAICPAVGGRVCPHQNRPASENEDEDPPFLEEEIIQADFEVPAQIKQIVEPRVTVEVAPDLHVSGPFWDPAPPPLFYTNRDGLVLLKLDWMNDLHPADTPVSLGVPVWARKLIRQGEDRTGSLLMSVGVNSDSRAVSDDDIFSFWVSFFR